MITATALKIVFIITKVDHTLFEHDSVFSYVTKIHKRTKTAGHARRLSIGNRAQKNVKERKGEKYGNTGVLLRQPTRRKIKIEGLARGKMTGKRGQREAFLCIVNEAMNRQPPNPSPPFPAI